MSVDFPSPQNHPINVAPHLMQSHNPRDRRPKFAFILGFEKCGTTSLADFLVRSGYCSYMVPHQKEPRLFRGAPGIMTKVMKQHAASASDEIWLTASVENIWQLSGLFDICDHAGEYRALILIRNQFDRMVSAFRFYREVNCRPLDAELRASICERFDWGHSGSYFRNGEKLPRYLRKEPPLGHYFHSIFNNLDGEEKQLESLRTVFDQQVQAFLRRNLLAQINYETQHWMAQGSFPELTVVGPSYYATAVDRALSILDPSKVMIVSSSRISEKYGLKRKLADFLGVEPSAQDILPGRLNQTCGEDIPEEMLVEARTFLAQSFAEDSRDLLDVLAAHPGVDLSLFDPESLFEPALSEDELLQAGVGAA
jgi:hypothetical protein